MSDDKRNKPGFMPIPPEIGKLRLMRDQLKAIFSNNGVQPTEAKLILCSYLYWKMINSMSYEEACNLSFERITQSDFEEDENVRCMIREYLNEKLWESVRHSCTYVEPEMGDDIVLFQEPRTQFATSESVSKLAVRLLSIDDFESVADLCCGYGGFMVAAHKKNPCNMITGYELSTDTAVAAELRALVMGDNVRVLQENVFSLGMDGDRKFTKIFCHPPYGGKRLNDLSASGFAEAVSDEYPELQKLPFTDWFFSTLAVTLLSPGGKAVCLMNNGTLRGSLERRIRENFVRRGLVEAVIALPPRLLYGSGTGVSLVVFSRGNKKVRMVDATGSYTEAYGMNILSEEDILDIHRSFKLGSSITKDVAPDELAANDYTLHPERYFMELTRFKNGVPLKSVIKHITRGVAWRREDVARLETDEETGIRYVNVNHLSDGMIEEDLPCLKSIDNRYRRYCLKNNDLLISKQGWKVAVGKVKEDEVILVTNNFYILDIDETKANPYYIQAFLESVQGKKLLKSISSGSAREFVAANDLENIEIPLPSLEEQQIIADSFTAAQDTVRILRNRINKAREKLKYIFEEAKEG